MPDGVAAVACATADCDPAPIGFVFCRCWPYAAADAVDMQAMLTLTSCFDRNRLTLQVKS
jgi:hypothetical protein